MDGKVVIGTSLDTKTFDKEINALESKLNDIEASLQMASEDKTLFSTSEIREMESEAEKLSNRLIDLRKKQSDVGKTDLSGITTQMKNIGSSLDKAVTKVARWGLALIGVRSIYSGIRKAISVVSQENEGFASQIDVMRSAIANALLPLAQTILNILAKIMIYINYIYASITGKNLFNFDKAWENTKKNAQSTAKSVGNIAKSAEKTKKALAGFDEMNILNDNTTASGGGGGAGGVKIPEVKNPFEGWENVEKPKWLDQIVEFGKWVLDNWQDVVFGLLLIKLVFDLLTGNWAGVLIDLIGLVVIAFFKLKDAVTSIYENGKQIFDMLIKWIDTNVYKWLVDHFGKLGEFFYIQIKFLVEFAKGIFESFWGGIKRVFEGIMKIIKGDFFGGIKDVFGGLLSIMTAPLQGFLKAAKSIIGKVWTLFKEINIKLADVIGSAFKGVINGVLWAIENILNNPIKQINKLVNVINKVPGINLSTLPTFKLPRLAKGAIASYPGRGIPTTGGGATWAEAGQEAYLPLTDSQFLSRLGQSIGEYITINANITNTMNGRVISRELQKINNESDFAFNR